MFLTPGADSTLIAAMSTNCAESIKCLVGVNGRKLEFSDACV
jgi:hypothetical protein